MRAGEKTAGIKKERCSTHRPVPYVVKPCINKSFATKVEKNKIVQKRLLEYLQIWNKYVTFAVLFSNPLKRKRMRVSELIKLLNQHGWALLREGKRHTIFANPKFDYTISVGRHQSQEVATGTANAILKKAGIK